MEFKDFLGRPIKPGDYFVQAERTGSNSPHLTFGRIVGFYEDYFTAWVVERKYEAGKHVGWRKSNSRLGNRTNTYNLVVLDNSLLTTFAYSGIIEALDED